MKPTEPSAHSLDFFGRDHNGSIMLYTLVFVAVVAVFFFSFSNVIHNLQLQVASNQKKADRQFDITQISKYMTMQSGLDESSAAPGNEALSVCLRGGAQASCVENCCESGKTTDFFFVDPTDNNPDINLKKKLTGPPASPAYFYANGSPCVFNSQNPGDCTYSLISTFEAQCPGAQADCEFAEHLKIKVRMLFNPLAQRNSLLMKDREFNLISFNKRNYRPAVLPISTVTLYLNNPTEQEVSVIGDSGNPSELQNFLFKKCESSNPSVVTLTSPPDAPFSGGAVKIKMKPMSLGVAQIKMQISDGGLENDTSKEYALDVNVLPGTGP